MTHSKHLGEYNEDGSVKRWPEVTVYGQAYKRPPGGTRRLAGTNYFVVLDPFPIPGFDREARIAELMEKVKPVPETTPVLTVTSKERGSGLKAPSE